MAAPRAIAVAALPRTVWVLAVVSLLNDAASDMVAPLLPLFLTVTLGAGPAIVALIEGVSEATASVVKLLAGRLADRGVPARRLILSGYGLASIARPLIGFAAAWTTVLALKFLDRLGKGLRSAPRDALLADSVPVELRGRAFGVHRAFDHCGAILGPILATVLLLNGVALREVFFLSAVLGVAVVATVYFGVPRPVPVRVAASPPLSFARLDQRLQALLLAAALLAAAAIPEAMVVLWATQQGLALAWVPLLWAAAHAVKSLVAWRGGLLVDRYSAKHVLALGWSARILALLMLALVEARGAAVWVAFCIYSATLAVTEAAERSWVAAQAPVQARGTAFGWFYLLSGIAALPGALLLGWLWQEYGAASALITAAAMSAMACLLMFGAARRGGVRV
jgi:MFS-type transporter involved in bile tolerance (Atg22 family)